MYVDKSRAQGADGVGSHASGHPGNFAELGLGGQELMDAVGVACFFMDAEGRFRAGNRTFFQLLGCGPEGLDGQPVYGKWLFGDIEGFRSTDRSLLAGSGATAEEAELVDGRGKRCAVVLKKNAWRDRAGHLSGVVVAVIDLSMQAAMQSALDTSESEKRAILDSFPGIVCLFDTHERVIWANGALLEVHPDPVGKTCHEIFCQREKACNTCAVPKSLATGLVQSTIQHLEMKTATGEERIYELTSTPVRDTVGKVQSLVVIGRDVTETAMLERQLRHTQKMEAIGTLAGGIAHDFNNVLTPIMGYAEILRFKMKQAANQEPTHLEFLEGILKAAKRAKKLVEQILTFSRSSEQRASLQYIHPIVKEVMKLMRVTLPTTITIKEEIDEQCGVVSVDPVHIHQILINLCTNSAHAMAGTHGTLTVSLASEGADEHDQEWLRMSVADTGSGIPPEMRERIFEPYFTTKEKSRGTGMGLAMVHGIVTRQGGRIEVKSEMGKGTTFDVFLPVSRAATRIDQVISTTDLVRGTGRILLVDDEVQVVQVTGELLTSLGYEVTGRTSARAALKLVEDNPDRFDLVLTDLTMPDLTGVELSRAIHLLRSDLPVVLFTGYSDQVSQEETEDAGIAQYCMKPVSLRELAKIIHQTLERDQAADRP